MIGAISATAGCLVSPIQPTEGSDTVLAGTDSAGATIELRTRKEGTANARVSDVVLGTAEAEVTYGTNHLAFTVDFPAGVSVTYTAETAAEAVPTVVEGTWVQHANNMFAEDHGVWVVTRTTDAAQ